MAAGEGGRTRGRGIYKICTEKAINHLKIVVGENATQHASGGQENKT